MDTKQRGSWSMKLTKKSRIWQNLGLSLLSVGFMACQGAGSSFENLGASGTSGGPSSQDAGELQDPTDFLSVDYVPNSYSGKAAPGVKNFEQVFQSMKRVTGLESASESTPPLSRIIGSPSLPGTYVALRAGLPGANALNAFVPTQMLNMVSLATTFCSEILRDPPSRGLFLAGTGLVDSSNNYISGRPDVVILANNASGIPNNVALARFFATKFWGPAVDVGDDRTTSEDNLAALAIDLAAYTGTGSATMPVTTMNSVVLGVCAAALSSGNVIFL